MQVSPGASAQEQGTRGREEGRGAGKVFRSPRPRSRVVQERPGQRHGRKRTDSTSSPCPCPPASLSPPPRRGGIEGRAEGEFGRYRLLSSPPLPRRPGPGTRKDSLGGKRAVQIPKSARGERSVAGFPNPRKAPCCLSSAHPGSLLPQGPQIPSSSALPHPPPVRPPPPGHLLRMRLPANLQPLKGYCRRRSRAKEHAGSCGRCSSVCWEV